MHRHAPLAAILCGAAVLRFWGLDFGLPNTAARPDEDAVTSVALHFLHGAGSPGFFDWPSLFMYVVCAGYIVFFQFGRLGGGFSSDVPSVASAFGNPGPLLVVARALSAGSGVLTVWVTARAGAVLFDRPTSLLAAFFLACAALHVRDSHFGVTDVAATCLAMQSFFHTVRYDRNGARRDAHLSAIWAGLAASTKYNAGLVLLPGLWTVTTRVDRVEPARPTGWRSGGIYGGLALTAFVVGTPYAVLDAPTFLSGVAAVVGRLGDGHGGLAGLGWSVHLRSSLWYGMGAPLLGAGLAGLGLVLVRNPGVGVLLAIFPVVYFVLIGAGRVAFARYVIPILPFLCLSGAYGVVEAARAGTRALARPALAIPVAWLLAALIAVPSLSSAVLTDHLLAAEDSRVVAATWIHENLPAPASIYQSGSYHGHVQLQTDPARPTPTSLVYDEHANVFRHRNGALAVPPELLVLVECPLEYCEVPRGVRRIAESQYTLRERITAHDSSEARVYDWADAFFVPLAGFAGVTRPGPNLSIYARLRAAPE